MSEYRLIKEIVLRSRAKSWNRAKLEWWLEEVYRQDDPDECLCGHFPINEICILRNVKNGASATVGNVCVKKFLGLPSNKIFRALGRIVADESKALNEAAIEHARGKGWITAWERTFYLDTMRKRRLSDPQLSIRIEINRKVLCATRRKSPDE